MAEEPVFIPCEICNEPVELSEYSGHTEACNSARFMEFHGVSLSDLLNPINQVHAPQPEIDFADNLASTNVSNAEPEDELEEELEEELEHEEDGPIGGEPQPNVRVIPIQISALLQALMGNIHMDELPGLQPPALHQQGGEPPLIDNLMERLQNLITAAAQAQQANGQLGDIGGLGNLEDVIVGLTPAQYDYCLTAKTRDEPGTCNICCEDGLEEMTNLICGHELCAPCATKHFSANVKCPFCNQDLRDMMTGST
jgi:hypothetical protein